MQQGREVCRTPEETWTVTPELASLITEELGSTHQGNVTPWNALMTIPVSSWKHQEDVPTGWEPKEVQSFNEAVLIYPSVELCKRVLRSFSENNGEAYQVTILTTRPEILQQSRDSTGITPNLEIEGPPHTGWQEREQIGAPGWGEERWYIWHLQSQQVIHGVAVDIDVTLRNFDTWAQEKQDKVVWSEKNLNRGTRRRYATDITEITKWLPHTNRRRGVALPEHAGYMPEGTYVWHEDAGRREHPHEGGGEAEEGVHQTQTCVVTGVDTLIDTQFQIWECPEGTTTNEGEIIPLTAIVRSIAEAEEAGDMPTKVLHVVTVDSGSTYAAWIAACDDRATQVDDRQMSPYAIELRTWERRMQGKMMICKQQRTW
eukprot:gene447-5052_t